MASPTIPPPTTPNGSSCTADDGSGRSYLDKGECASCLVAANGGIWWEIGHPSFATGGCINVFCLEPLADDHVDQPEEEEEADAHGDCVIFFGDDEYVVVYYVSGQITFVEPYANEAASELQLNSVTEKDALARPSKETKQA